MSITWPHMSPVWHHQNLVLAKVIQFNIVGDKESEYSHLRSLNRRFLWHFLRHIQHQIRKTSKVGWGNHEMCWIITRHTFYYSFIFKSSSVIQLKPCQPPGQYNLNVLWEPVNFIISQMVLKPPPTTPFQHQVWPIRQWNHLLPYCTRGNTKHQSKLMCVFTSHIKINQSNQSVFVIL